MKNRKHVISQILFWAATGFIIILFVSACYPWGPGPGGPGWGGGMGGGAGTGSGVRGGGSNMGQGDMGGMMGGMGGMGGRGMGQGGMGSGGMEDMMQRMMGGGMMGENSGMEPGRGGNNAPTAPAVPINMDAAAEAARKYIYSYGKDLKLQEIAEFAQNFYATVMEDSSSISAVEILIDRYTGQAYPETGPNMMWNTKYGMMSGSSNQRLPNITLEEDISLAQDFLSRQFPGSTAGDARTFYGYYTLYILREGKIWGVLSVNSYSGQVWFHNWHGPFIGIKKYDA